MRYPACATERNKPCGCDAIICCIQWGWGYHRLGRTEQASMCLKWWNARRTPTSHHDVAELYLDILTWSIVLNHACNWITDNSRPLDLKASDECLWTCYCVILYWKCDKAACCCPIHLRCCWSPKMADFHCTYYMQQQLQSQGNLCTDMIHMQMLTKHTDTHRNNNINSSMEGTCVTSKTRWPRFCAADTYCTGALKLW